MPSSLKQVAEALFLNMAGLPLVDWIKDQRDDGASWRQVTTALHTATEGVLDLPAQTVHSWSDGYTPDPTDAAAADLSAGAA